MYNIYIILWFREDAVNNSPIYLTEKMAISKDCHFIITLGENEPPELLRQSQKLNEVDTSNLSTVFLSIWISYFMVYQILQSLHVITSFTIIPNVDHYDIIENLCEDVFPLTQVS